MIMKRNKKECIKCKREISLSNYDKHFKSCNEKNKKKKRRGIDFDPNHGYKDGTRKTWNKGLTKYQDNRIKKQGESSSITKKSRPPVGCCAWSRDKNSENAKRLRLGGYRNNAGRSKKFKVVDSFGKETTLQSSYEYFCFEILKELNIRWVRPKAIRYDDRNYFADFYLVDFDVYLDPKNSYKKIMDENKILSVREQNNIKLYVLSKDQITKEYITGIVVR